MLQIVTLALKRVLQDRKGISAMEYTVLAVGIVAAVAAGATMWAPISKPPSPPSVLTCPA